MGHERKQDKKKLIEEKRRMKIWTVDAIFYNIQCSKYSRQFVHIFSLEETVVMGLKYSRCLQFLKVCAFLFLDDTDRAS